MDSLKIGFVNEWHAAQPFAHLTPEAQLQFGSLQLGQILSATTMYRVAEHAE